MGHFPRPIAADLPGIASRLLAMAVDWLGDDAPGRVYRSVGVPVWDLSNCAQLVIFPGTGVPGMVGSPTTGRPEISQSVQLRTYTFTLELARCVATVADDTGAPSSADLDAAGERALKDYRALDRFIAGLGFNSKIEDETLKALGVKSVAAGQLSTVGPQGGIAAVRAALGITI